MVAHPGVRVAHLFRTERSNYVVDDTHVLFNLLRLVTLHLSQDRVDSVLGRLDGHPDLPAARAMLADSDTLRLREELHRVRVRSDDWFLRSFLPHLAPEPPPQEVPVLAAR